MIHISTHARRGVDVSIVRDLLVEGEGHEPDEPGDATIRRV